MTIVEEPEHFDWRLARSILLNEALAFKDRNRLTVGVNSVNRKKLRILLNTVGARVSNDKGTWVSEADPVLTIGKWQARENYLLERIANLCWIGLDWNPKHRLRKLYEFLNFDPTPQVGKFFSLGVFTNVVVDIISLNDPCTFHTLKGLDNGLVVCYTCTGEGHFLAEDKHAKRRSVGT